MTSLARLTACCYCGTTRSVPCADVSGIPAATNAIGWDWYAGVGLACSPACADASEAAAALRQGRDKRQVFSEAGA